MLKIILTGFKYYIFSFFFQERSLRSEGFFFFFCSSYLKNSGREESEWKQLMSAALELVQPATEKAYAGFNMHHLKQSLNSSRFLASSSPVREEGSVTQGLVSLHSLYNKYIHYLQVGKQLPILECGVTRHLHRQVMLAKFNEFETKKSCYPKDSVKFPYMAIDKVHFLTAIWC